MEEPYILDSITLIIECFYKDTKLHIVFVISPLVFIFIVYCA